ncbi:MAG: hypothetical protein EXR07_12100 [Acetobacteraceae bacterium]|nr:hypothetical protein [Acetobacteraceae bacterium]
MALTDAFRSRLPKPPALDKDDLKAVKTFLPGKAISRTAALLSLIVLALGFAGLIDQGLKFIGLERPSPQWLYYSLLFGLPMLAVLVQLAIEWRADRNRRERLILAVATGEQPAGYFRIGPYTGTPEDRKQFNRADRAHEKVLDWVRTSASLPLYLTGDSGSGKTSVLSAFVLPALRDQGWIVVEARAFQTPEGMLREALRRLPGMPRPRAGKEPATRALVEAAAHAGQGLLLVLDQFEEFVILASPQEQTAFLALLADLRDKPIPGVRMLLSLRSDYQALLQDIGLPAPRQGENLFQVARFTLSAATAFFTKSGLKLAPEAVERLLNSAARLDETPGLLRPITLNVLGHVLATGQGATDTLDAGQLIDRYIRRTIEQPAIRDQAPLVLEQLVTEQATKRPRTEDELAAATHLPRGVIRAVLNSLAAAMLARPLDPVQAVWELSHDFVARAVAYTQSRRRTNVTRRAVAYAAPGLLGLAVTIGLGMAALDRFSPYQLRKDLADLGLTVHSVAYGVVIERNSRLTPDNFARAAGFLEKLNAHVAVIGVDLSGTQVANLDPLKGMTALQTLDLSGTEVVNLDPLKGMTALQTLDLSGTEVVNLDPLKGMTALQTLNLRGIQVANLDPLKGMTALQTLDLSGTEVVNLDPLKGTTALQTLYLSGTEVVNLDPLKGMTALQTLNLRRTQVANLDPLKGLTALQTLLLNQTQVANLDPLKGMTALQTLYLSQTQVANLDPLKGMTALRTLDLSQTQVANLDPLKGMTALQWLYLDPPRIEALRSTLDELARFRHENGSPELQVSPGGF